MAVGLRIFNDDGISQIMDTARNLVMIAKGQATTVGGFNAGGGLSTEITLVHDGPVLFAAYAPSGAAANFSGKTGTTYKFHVIFANKSETATWYAFSYPKNIQSTSGLRVFTADGTLAYDSKQKPLRISVPFNVAVNPSPNSPPQNQLPTYPPAPASVNLDLPTQKDGRIYAALGLAFPPHRVWYRYKIASKTYLVMLGYFYYLPVTTDDGITLIARHVTGGSGQDTPVGTWPYGGIKLYQGTSSYAQSGWIIDVTDY